MTKTIDPVFSSEVLRAPELACDSLDIDTIAQSLHGLKGEVDKNPQTAAIILAGGTGERFGKEGGKQLVEIAGKPILTWSAEASGSRFSSWNSAKSVLWSPAYIVDSCA